MSLILTVLLAQAAVERPVAVIVVSKRPQAETLAPKVAAAVRAALEKAGLSPLLDDATIKKELARSGVTDPRTCEGRTDCSSKLALLLNPNAIVVGVDVGRVTKNLAIDVHAVSGTSKESLANLQTLLPLDKWESLAGPDLEKFVADLKTALKAATAVVKKPEEPVVEVKTVKKDPPLPKPKVEEPTPAPLPAQTKPTPIAAYALLGTGGVAIVTGAILGVIGLTQKGTYDGAKVPLCSDTGIVCMPGMMATNGFGTTLSLEQATQLSQSVNGLFTASLITTLLGFALAGTGAALLFL